MPLKVNVGLNRKIGEANYGSRGASVNVELELDSSLIGEPVKFQERIRQVYNLARTSLDEELNGGNGQAGNGHANGNGAQHAGGNTNNNGNGTPPNNGQRPRQATQSQVKALHAIARNQRFDLARYLAEHYHVNRPEDLELKTASKIIEGLNAANQPGRST